jgi:cellulose synthase/poly-beta-1,6-N-acetylglucosamine synthase-like glycosyltransferase
MSSLTLAALILLAYTFAGYPIIVALMAWVFPRRYRTSTSYQPSVSVCMSVYDGARYLAAKLDSLLDLDYPSQKIEFLVYCDGCTDDSEQIVQRYQSRDLRVRLIRGAHRLGKPTALNRLARAALGEVLIMTDVRQPLDRKAVQALVQVLADPDIGCVSGNLELQGNAGSAAYWKYEKLIRSSEGRLGAMVGVSGSIYAIRKADFPELPSDVILDDVWVPLTVSLRHKRVVFSPDAVAYDKAFDDGREFNRKVRTLAGNYQLLARMPEALVPFANPTWFPLYSHKLLRLVCPWLLVVLFVDTWYGATVAVPASLIEQALLRSLALGQLFFYALAALGSRAGRFGTIARTFVMLNLAAVVGLWRYLRREQQVTW